MYLPNFLWLLNTRSCSYSCRNLLNTGLGRFGLGKQQKPQPSDHATVILFMIGGVCMADLRAVNSPAVAEASKTHFITGGTTLLAPLYTLNHLF